MTDHVPAPPTDTLTGRWTVERAVKGDTTSIRTGAGPRRLREWGLTLRHAQTNVVAVATYRAAIGSTFTVGQELTGRIVTTWAGDTFRRDPAAVGTRRG